jgi:hypothetical protein
LEYLGVFFVTPKNLPLDGESASQVIREFAAGWAENYRSD